MFSVGASCKSTHRRMSLSSTWLGSTSSSGFRQFRFPDSGTLGGKLIKDYAWKEQTEYFGVDLKTEIIEVNSDNIRPGSKIEGQLVIETKFPIEHDGIFIQLEALCSLNYSTKFNERTSMHKGKGCILENTKLNAFGHLESPPPLKCEIVPVTPPEFGGHSINSGVWHYPFQLQIPCDPRLPAPFQNSHGNLDYRLVVYMISHSSATYVKLAEKNMSCEGHYNLYDDLEESSKPIVIEQHYRKSYFSQKKQVKSTLSVSTTGFLPEENIPFTVHVKNPKCIPLHLSVHFLQLIKYQATSSLASLVKIVTTVGEEKYQCDEPKPEIQWTGDICIPENQVPTYVNSMYSVNYLLQIKSPEGEIIVSGNACVLIGTSRNDPIKQEQGSSADDFATGASVPRDLYRSGSESSIHSQRIYSTPIAYSVPENLNLSIDEPDEDHETDQQDDQTGNQAEETEEAEQPHMTSSSPAQTFPPSYSTLSSRIPSTETLPPNYADLEPPASLIIGDAVDLEKRYSINLDTLNLQDDEYQVTFYSV